MLTIICHQKAKKSKNLTSDQYRELSKRIKETYIFIKKEDNQQISIFSSLLRNFTSLKRYF